MKKNFPETAINSNFHIRRSIFLIFFLLSLNCLNTCKSKNSSGIADIFSYQIPAETDDGWETASLSEVNIDETSLVKYMNEFLNTYDHKIHGIIIVKDKKLVFEEYFSGYAFYHGPYSEFNRLKKHNIASVTKSVTSALTGLTVDKGYIQNVNEKVFNFFPEYSYLRNDDKDKITLEHLLTMTSGFQWDEKSYQYSDYRNDCFQMYIRSDPVKFILEKPVVDEPGTNYNYNGGCVILLGEIIRKATGLRADKFAEQSLFSPLGITDFWWEELQNDICYTSGDMKLRPRDMAKFGNLYLNKGYWKEERIISEDWVNVSTQAFIRQNPLWECGYLWWLHTYEFNGKQFKAFAARGWGGQQITVFPEYDLVVVFTAGYYDEPDMEFHIYILTLNILNSLIS